MSSTVSSDMIESLSFVLDWAASYGLDSIVSATARTLSENNCEVSEAFNQRRLFFEALLCLKNVNYGTGKDNFIEILSILDEIEKAFKTEANRMHFKWVAVRTAVVFQIGICKMRDILCVPVDNVEPFDIPNDFNYSAYLTAMKTLASVHFEKATDIEEFVAAFTTDLLTKKENKKFFSKRKTNALCDAHSLTEFQKTVGGFLTALQRAVLPIPKLTAVYAPSVVDPLLSLRQADVTDEQRNTSGPYANGNTNPKTTAAASSSSSSSGNAPKLPASPPLTAPAPATSAESSRNAPPPPKKPTAPVAAAVSSPTPSVSGSTRSHKPQAVVVAANASSKSSSVPVPVPVVTASADGWMDGGRKRKLETTASVHNTLAGKKTNIISSSSKPIRKASKIEFEDSDIDSPTTPEESEDDDNDDNQDRDEDEDEDDIEDDDEEEEVALVGRHKNTVGHGQNNNAGHSSGSRGATPVKPAAASNQRSSKKDAVLQGLGLSASEPTSQRTKWSLEEEEALIAGLEDYGTNWAQILTDRRWSNIWRSHHRTNVNLKDKYRNLLKNGIVKQY